MNYGFLVAGLGAAVLVAVWLVEVVQDRRLRRLVWQNLDSAHEGGQFDPDGYSNDSGPGHLCGMTTFDVCADMALECEDVAGYSEEQLFPHVHAWMISKGLAT